MEINIKNYNHAILGEMLVFADERGLWFMYNDVCKCLSIDKNTSRSLFKNVIDGSQVCVVTNLDLGEGDRNYRFIQEQAVYKCMMRSDTKFSIEFQNWLSDIAYNARILDKTYNDHINGGLTSRYYSMKETLDSIDSEDPRVLALKNNFDKFGKGLIEENVLSENIEYRTDYSIDEAYDDPYFNIGSPSKKVFEEYKVSKDIFYKEPANESMEPLSLFITSKNGMTLEEWVETEYKSDYDNLYGYDDYM